MAVAGGTVHIPKIAAADATEGGDSLAQRIARRRQDSARRRQMESPRGREAPPSPGSPAAPEGGRAQYAPSSPAHRPPLAPSAAYLAEEPFECIGAGSIASEAHASAPPHARMQAATPPRPEGVVALL